jgi:hypothetical protein
MIRVTKVTSTSTFKVGGVKFTIGEKYPAYKRDDVYIVQGVPFGKPGQSKKAFKSHFKEGLRKTVRNTKELKRYLEGDESIALP